uniref:Uncharacterized protein n=1 Tax=Glossina palpalis gambiensis TaxID=67801 RepID=A0A1B0C0D3_9MUSC
MRTKQQGRYGFVLSNMRYPPNIFGKRLLNGGMVFTISDVPAFALLFIIHPGEVINDSVAMDLATPREMEIFIKSEKSFGKERQKENHEMN